MVAYPAPAPGRRAEGAGALGVYVIGGLLILLGAAALALAVTNVVDIINTAIPGEAAGTTLLRYLNIHGIILPALTVGAGVLLLVLGIRVFSRQARAAAWARQLILWVALAAIVGAVQGFGAGASGDGGTAGRGLEWALPFVIAAVAFGGAWWWMGQNGHLFRGMETLGEASSRSAWNLLLPTLAIMIVVALRPLEKTFIASLTNDRFADSRPAEFIGFQNYTELLSFRFDRIECVRDDAGACTLDENGAIVFPRPRDVLDEGYQQLRFREASGLTIGETRIIFSARDRDFYESVSNTLIFSFFSVTIELTLGLFVAMVINSRFPGRGLMRAAMLVPWAIPTVVSAKLWDVMLRPDQSGVINHFLLNIGAISQSQAWLANPDLQLPALIFVDVWKTTPFMALVLLAGLQVIPGDLYEAADVDGASKLRQFFSITLPLLRPAIAVALVFRTLDAVRVFDVFQVLLERARLSMATYNYQTLIVEQELGKASAIGVVIFIIILIFTVLYVRILGVSAE